MASSVSIWRGVSARPASTRSRISSMNSSSHVVRFTPFRSMSSSIVSWSCGPKREGISVHLHRKRLLEAQELAAEEQLHHAGASVARLRDNALRLWFELLRTVEQDHAVGVMLE